MTENFALLLLKGFKGFVKQVKFFDRAIENYTVSTFWQRDTVSAAEKLGSLFERQATYMRRLKFVREVLSRMKKADRQSIVYGYIRGERAADAAVKMGCCLSTFYRTRKRAFERFYAICQALVAEYDL